MLIRGARIAFGPETSGHVNLWLHEGRISFAPMRSGQDTALNLEGYMVLPGLINAHDHLELNLFPRLGCGPYPNASAWAHDIYRPHEPPIKQHLRVPKHLRLRWGATKNLLSGVTTVAHHNAFHPVFEEADFPVRVVRRYGWAHSLQFSPDWKARFEKTAPNEPFIIHAAEGTDEAARNEISVLEKAGALGGSTILVHGVGLDPNDVPLVLQRRAGIVWCPSSNHFTLKRSLDASVLSSAIPIALATDSAITAVGDLLDELRVAHQSVPGHPVPGQRLYRMVTSEPARMLKLPAGFGKISNGGPADLTILKDTGCSPATALLVNTPELVVVRGRIQMVSSQLAKVCPQGMLKDFERVEIDGRGSFLLAESISSMLLETKIALQEQPRLAGKAIAA